MIVAVNLNGFVKSMTEFFVLQFATESGLGYNYNF